MMFPYFTTLPGALLLLALISWSIIWKYAALWKAGRNNQPVWFMLIFFLNTLGVLPILYILCFQKKRAEATPEAQKAKKKKKKTGKEEYISKTFSYSR